MPYHIEHHVLPTVPFHRLPAFHQLTKDHLVVTQHGYARFQVDYLRSAWEGSLAQSL
jgi:fatty acid desaturase